MASALTWLDYSERDRRRALDVIDLFRETGTVDELGLASVRDSFSDLFFPGTSTIQTRACYFLLVPWTFQRLERLRVPSDKARARARQAELNLNRRMLAADDTRGVFGSQAGDALKRLPGDVYWGGLGDWGIRMFRGYKWAYLRSLDSFYRRNARFRSDSRDPEGTTGPPTNWHPHLPAPPSGFPYQQVSVALRRRDAAYLRERIQTRHPKSLLGALAGRAAPDDLQAARPWDLARDAGLSPVLRDQLLDARLFSVSMQGAALLYNLMLAEQKPHEAWMEKYRNKLETWAADVETLRPRLESWNPEAAWEVVPAQGRSLGYPTRIFIGDWIESLRRGRPGKVADDAHARSLVRNREVQLKRARARLTNPRRLELWGGESGTGLMTYRWEAAKRILTDIFDGLARSEGDAGNA